MRVRSVDMTSTFCLSRIIFSFLGRASLLTWNGRPALAKRHPHSSAQSQEPEGGNPNKV